MSIATLPRIVDRWSAEFHAAYQAYRTTNPVEIVIYESKERGKRGGTVRHFGTSKEIRTKVVVGTMHRVYREAYPGRNYIVNNWQHPTWIDGVAQGEAQGKIVYTRTLNEARAIARQMVAQGL